MASLPAPAASIGSLPERFAVLDTTDLDESRECTTRLMGAHRSRLLRPRVPFHSRIHAAPLGRHVVTVVRSESWISVTSDVPQSAWSVWLPLSGQTLHRVGHRIIAVAGTDGVALAPSAPLSMVAAGLVEAVIVRLDPSAFGVELAARRQRAEAGSDGRAGSRVLNGACVARVLDLLAQWRNRLDDGSPMPDFTSGHMEAAIASVVAGGVTEDDAGGVHDPDAGRRVVRRAEDVIWQNAEAPLSIGILATAVGVSARSLIRAFARVRGYGPMEAVRQARLLSVRAELLERRPGTSVSAVAMRWGFLHLGRFSGAYARQYGELPSATLRRLGGGARD